MKALRLALVVVVVAMGAGCAHPMIIKPEMEKLSAAPQSSKIAKNVGLYIAAPNREKEVTTPGGGGDKVRYKPYADLESGLYKVLGDVFQDVTLLKATNDEAVAKRSLVYIIEPEVTTTSSSSGVFTWMATDFTVQLTCKVTDPTGQVIGTVSSSGTGHAVFDELKSNFSLAGQRASEDALVKLRGALLQAPELRK
jgi:hypothetical protein